MEYIDRIIDKYLEEWKDSSAHKPLLLRGARQVGKSSAVRHLGRLFENFAEVNFERLKSVHSFFEGDIDVRLITAKLSKFLNVDIVPGKTLLFFDEIQECPQAIMALRFFWEDLPELHVVAAGSLLEFTLEELPTFGVGRIRSLFMYPLTFDEFLVATGNNGLLAGAEVRARRVRSTMRFTTVSSSNFGYICLSAVCRRLLPRGWLRTTSNAVGVYITI